MLICDSHLDLGMNALRFNRNLLKTVDQIRAREIDLKDQQARRWPTPRNGCGVNTVSIPEMKRANVFLSFVTTVSRIEHSTNQFEGYDGQEISYASAMGQISYYRLLEQLGHVRILSDWPTVEAHLREWENASDTNTLSLEFVFSMEGADPITSSDQVPEWWETGMRIVGLSHYGKSSYAHGTGCEGGLTKRAYPLLKAFEEVGMILDLTHLSTQSFWEAVEAFPGQVVASHNNCRALVPGDRQFSDDQIRKIVERNGVIGVAMDTWMLQPGWNKGIYNPVKASLETVVNHIDHICEIAGNVNHVGIGTDLDGGFGREQSPKDLNTIMDLQKIPVILRNRAYSEEDVERIMYGNWLRILKQAWNAM